MTAATLGEALALGMQVKAWCRRGRAHDTRRKSSRECTNQAELDLETLVCTRGRDFPVERLARCLKCPRCGSRYISIRFF